MYSFTGRVFPPMRRPLHLILHHLAVHLNVSTGGNLPPQLSDAGCERLYLLRIISRGSFTLSAIERLTLRCKSVIFSLQIFFVSQQFVKRCDLPFPQKVTLPPVAIVLQEIIAQQVSLRAGYSEKDQSAAAAGYERWQIRWRAYTLWIFESPR